MIRGQMDVKSSLDLSVIGYAKGLIAWFTP